MCHLGADDAGAAVCYCIVLLYIELVLEGLDFERPLTFPDGCRWRGQHDRNR
jgi:hypothetical protein